MASASAPANELAKQLPATASSLAVPPPAASTAEAVDLPAGAAIRGLLLQHARAAAASTRASFLPGKQAQRRGYNASSFHLIVSAFSLLALAFLLSGHTSQAFRVYVLVHGLRFCVRGVIIVFLLYPTYECGLLCPMAWM